MEIKTLRLTDIKPYWRNPRNNEPAIEATMTSIKKYGYKVPIVVDKKNVIIAGHTRYKSLLRLGGFDEIQCVIWDLPAAEAKEYRIVDNKTGEMAEWLPAELSAELREVKNLADLQIFFPDVQVEQLVSDSTGTTNWNSVTQGDIDKRQEQLEGSFKALSDAKGDAKVECICPHCNESFYLDKRDLSKA